MSPQQISDDPIYGFKRKVELSAINIGIADFVGKRVQLMLSVNYYEADASTMITVIPPKIVSLTADETIWVDANGIIVPEGDPSAVMTEYDFFLTLLDVPIVISTLVSQKISWADSLQRFDS